MKSLFVLAIALFSVSASAQVFDMPSTMSSDLEVMNRAMLKAVTAAGAKEIGAVDSIELVRNNGTYLVANENCQTLVKARISFAKLAWQASVIPNSTVCGK